MGTWEEESSSLLESQNEINKALSSEGTRHDVDVDAEVEVVNVDVDECCDHESHVAIEQAALAKQFERLDFQDNGCDGFKTEEEQGEYDGDYEGKNQVYPLRPYAVECSFYIKTGTCKFGQNCRYNHPPMSGSQTAGDKETGFEDSYGSGGDAGNIDCKYFQTPGGCKYGDGCRYNHPAPEIEREYIELNCLGLPIRPSAQECTFYLRNGSCGYGANCRFHHPDPTAMKEFESKNPRENDKSVKGGNSTPRSYGGEQLQSFGTVSQGTSESSNGMIMRNGPPCAPDMRSYHQTISPSHGWNQSQGINSFPSNKFPRSHQVVNNFSKRLDPSTHYENPMQSEDFPERPGQPDCDYFMKTGNCKYRSACRFNHPVSLASNKQRLPPHSSKGLFSRPVPMLPAESSQHFNPNSNNMWKNGMSSTNHMNHLVPNSEFPERPEQPECEYYMKTGQCKFMSACRYHHPKNRVPTSSQRAFSEKGLPLRPGAKLCRNYEQHGICKYGHKCLYNHPDDYSPEVTVSTQFHSSTDFPVISTNLEPPVASNVNSAWDDGWEI